MDQQVGTVSGAVLAGRDAAHPDGQYTTVAKWFHWVTVVLMLVALSFGFVIKYIKTDPFETKLVFYAIHESAGLTILFVSLARLAWRRFHPPPPLPDHVPMAIRRAAAGVHHALYALLILQPIVGFVATNAWGFPMQGATAYLGFIDLPAVVGETKWLAEILSTIHTVFAYAIVVLLVAHVGGAIYHHALRGDGTLMRML
ncbi:cytochrome b/b6 domain-containing protein [Elioraea tepida]|uniref:Cytochrome b/b6 domain-containing protein n=1 Tax=Elioraea tepida TaxID=2843330 RepID=A0A975U4E8_9PROT|nr:cytochrome b/b6 domain-containing protein [Elioraea tepida]QXM25369.1 cytochrome b/b6 domain-containing protein [Elioraea tepida]